MQLHCTAYILSNRRYVVPGGSAAHYMREGYTFDVGSSMMFGFGDKGTTNLITKALEAVGKRLPTVPDPTQIHYHLPKSAAHPEARCIISLQMLSRVYGFILDSFTHIFILDFVFESPVVSQRAAMQSRYEISAMKSEIVGSSPEKLLSPLRNRSEDGAGDAGSGGQGVEEL